MTDASELASKLESLGYIELFQRLDNQAIDSIWTSPAARMPLESVAHDPNAPFLARFLAAEILFLKVDAYPPATAKTGLAKVYAKALEAGFTEMANPWSLPGSLDGMVAQHALAIGPAAIPEFRRLLDDGRSVSYWGSREATMGNSYRYRVKDVAASLVAALQGERFKAYRRPAERDPEIAKLRSAL